MRLTADTLVGGRPAREVRPVLRGMQRGPSTPGRIARDAGWSDDEVVDVVARLLEEGLLVASEPGVGSLAVGEADRDERLTARLGLQPTRWGPGAVELTTHGHAAANASFARPVKRATAQRHLDALLERVEALNADPEAKATVEGVWLFGSFTDPQVDRVGDVDVILDVAPRGDRPLLHEVLDVWKRLKGGSAVISLHDKAHLDLEGVTAHRIHPRT